MQAGDTARRARLADNALQAARDKLDGLLQGQAARQLIELAGNPQPLPHGAEVRWLLQAPALHCVPVCRSRLRECSSH
jgi:hypothetical protein